MSQRRGADRRVEKTRTLLHGALASLVHEKPYDDIVVQEILTRADVGRSTFYAHYRDKDELLDRGIRDLLRLDARPPERCTGATERLLRFSLPFLEHVERYREHGELPMDPSGAAAIHEHLRRVLEDALASELRSELGRHPASRADAVPAELLARHVAGTFVLALGWWLEHPERSAREVDGWFRELVGGVLGD
jgi:AcrR family transcriptional regulator